MLGITSDQAIGQTAADIMSEQDFAAYPQNETDLRERGEIEIEVRLNNPHREVWASALIRRGADEFALIAVRDVTEKRRAAEEQEDMASINGLLSANANVLTWRFSPVNEQFIVDATRETRSNLLMPLARELGLEEMLQRVDETHRQEFIERLFASVHSGEPGNYDFRHKAEDDRHEHFRAFWRGMRRGADGRWLLVGLTQDITEIMEARDAALAGKHAAEVADGVKSRFLSNMNHEFRTPLNGVLGVLHLLKREALSDGAKKLVGEAEASGRVLTALLNDLLDLANLNAGQISVAYEPVDPSTLVESVLALYQPAFDGKGLTVQTVVPEGGSSVIIDPVRLRQILSSLIGNASKFTSKGGVTVRLLSIGEQDSHRIRIEVEDTGIGIGTEMMRSLFVEFRQGDAATTRSFGGAGLGLALSRRLAHLMGGEIGGHSELGRGSTFWVELPAPLVLVAETADEADAPLEGLRVLVVDDNATNRLVAKNILSQFGASVESASDGALAVAAVKAGAFDIVLMDIQMPVMDGIAASLNIRALPAPIGQVPIVAMTANVSPEQVDSYRAAGMDGVIAKPVSPSSIISEIARLSGHKDVSSVYRLTYYSRALPDVISRADEAMREILSVAVRLNEPAHITGALLGCGGWFLQALEGAQENVEAVFGRISEDRRHENIMIMRSDYVDERLFADWSMCGLQLSQTDKASLGFLGDDGIFDPPALSEIEAVELLTAVTDLQRSEMARQ
jgi:signal transduction histidine kinase/CheY-like chemotaxis protein